MKKKFLFIAGMLAICHAGICQNNLNEGFESDVFPPIDWTVYPDTTQITRDSTAHTGSYCALMIIENFEEDSVKRWLITPKLRVSSYSDSLTFYFTSEYRPNDVAGVDSLFVLVSTTGKDTNSFNTILYREDVDNMTNREYQKISVSLANFINQTIYIAIMCKDDLGFNWFYIDDVTGPVIADDSGCTDIKSLPYTENFDTYSINDSNAYPTCWTRVTTSCNDFLNTCVPYITSSMADTTSYLFFFTMDSDYAAAILPKLADSINVSELQISFDYQSRWSDMPFIIGIMTDPSDVNTFVAVDSVKATQELNWQNFEVSLASYTGEGKYIALYLGQPFTNLDYPSCFVDNLVIDYRTKCTKPYNLIAKDITSSQVNIAWYDNTQSGNYTLYYKEQNTNEWDSIFSSDTIITLSDLQSFTKYNLFVVNNCSENTFSINSDTISFTTLCTDETVYIIDTICNNEIYSFFENNLTQSGIYTHNLRTENGCDSNIILNLTVNPTFNDTINASISDNEAYNFNNQSLTQSGTYTANFTSINGCDSIVVLNLEVNAGLNDMNTLTVLKLFPNPAEEYLEIQTTKVVANSNIKIMDLSNKVLLEQDLSNDLNNTRIDISTLKTGVYIALIQLDKDIYRLKFVKRK